jgi:hypothetical protein
VVLRVDEMALDRLAGREHEREFAASGASGSTVAVATTAVRCAR